MTITNYTALIEQIVNLLKANDMEKPQYNESILMNVDQMTGAATAFIVDANKYTSGYFIGSRSAHYDDTWLSDMIDDLSIRDIALILKVNVSSLVYNTNVYRYDGVAYPHEISVHDVEEYVYHNPILKTKVLELYTDFQNDNTDRYHDAALEMWNIFVYDYNYHATRKGKDVLQWEG